jgi:hypothetical protein
MPSKRRSELGNFVAAALAGPIPPLGDADLTYLRNAIEEIAPDCSVELEGICPQDATLVVVPEDGDDFAGPSFVVSRETYGLRVSQVQWDEISEIGVFASLSDVVLALEVRLVFTLETTLPPTVTLH